MPTVNSGNTLDPVVTNVDSSTGMMTLGFPEPVSLDSSETAVRQLRGREAYIFNDDMSEGAVYEVFDMLEIELTSSDSEDADPVHVDWSLSKFDGQVADVQMDLDGLRQSGVNLKVYDNI